MIEVNNLRKTFDSVNALDGIGFTARDGEVTGLIGPNGAGKTTALRIIYTVMRPDCQSALNIDPLTASNFDPPFFVVTEVVPVVHRRDPRCFV